MTKAMPTNCPTLLLPDVTRRPLIRQRACRWAFKSISKTGQVLEGLIDAPLHVEDALTLAAVVAPVVGPE